eukprot:Hpha_TRINITY_DN15360_c3_g6::TRINITY_DN15360_c3_g6_i1::g.90440::m.90440
MRRGGGGEETANKICKRSVPRGHTLPHVLRVAGFAAGFAGRRVAPREDVRVVDLDVTDGDVPLTDDVGTERLELDGGAPGVLRTLGRGVAETDPEPPRGVVTLPPVGRRGVAFGPGEVWAVRLRGEVGRGRLPAVAGLAEGVRRFDADADPERLLDEPPGLCFGGDCLRLLDEDGRWRRSEEPVRRVGEADGVLSRWERARRRPRSSVFSTGGPATPRLRWSNQTMSRKEAVLTTTSSVATRARPFLSRRS